jgi:hypothetical protein
VKIASIIERGPVSLTRATAVNPDAGIYIEQQSIETYDDAHPNDGLRRSYGR